MERRRLGKSGLEVPVVGLGTWKVFNVRDDAGQARCDAVVDAALDCGANLFDSSPMYGESERVLAQALEGRRDAAIVTTKVWAKNRAVGMEQMDRALKWFERIDVYQVHNLLATMDHLPRLEELKANGVVHSLGATHYLASSYRELIELMREGLISVVQVPYHPGERAAEKELFDEATRLDIGVIIMSPLGSGRLLEAAPSAQELAPLSSFGVYTWAQVLLKWVLSDDRVHVAIPATSSPDHMRENAAAGEPPWFGGDERMYVRRLYGKYAA